MDVSSPFGKLIAVIATGISDESVNDSGVENVGGWVGKNSLRYFENCDSGPKTMAVSNTRSPSVSVRRRLTPPDPADGFAIAIAVVFSFTGTTGHQKGCTGD